MQKFAVWQRSPKIVTFIDNLQSRAKQMSDLTDLNNLSDLTDWTDPLFLNWPNPTNLRKLNK